MNKEVLVSKATKKNWKRLNVDSTELQKRLSKRANKRFSKKTFIPIEYFSNSKNLEILEEILNYSKDIKTTIYSLGINLLCANNLLNSDNPYITEILNEFHKGEPDERLLKINLPSEEKDFLGIVYQSLLSEGTKNQKGSYYTPQKIINDIDFNPKSDMKFLDPCCGTGSFLLFAADKIKNPQNIFGCDLDNTACFIAKINLIIKYKNIKFRPNILNCDFLLADNIKDKFDIIGTNPPWGAVTNAKYKLKFPQIKSGETYSYFLYKAEKYLKNNGEMFFVLPESIMNVKLHADIREFILKTFEISKIIISGRAFSGVLSNTVTLSLIKKQNKNNNIIIKKDDKILNIKQKFYLNNINCNFSVLDNKDANIIEKIYSLPHKKLDKNSIWAIGIVTGNNSKYISENSFGGEKIYSGKNITYEGISDTNKYINYQRKNFQQTAPDEIYRAKEKLVYKFISRKPVFAYDEKQRLFLNSANILIPKLKGYTIKEVMAFLNSELFEYIYLKKFNEIKILKGNLMELPFPKAFENTNKITNENIFEIFNLTPDEINHIKSELLRYN